MSTWGTIVILNGVPRSGKSSIANAIVKASGNSWRSTGVDAMMAMTPDEYQPGIGLRPGGERPDLEPMVKALFESLYVAVANHSRDGTNVVVDVGHHDNYSRPLGTLRSAAHQLAQHRVMLVGVRCPLSVIMDRRRSSGDTYLTEDEDGHVPEPVRLWQQCVHDPGIYDLEVDTSILSPVDCAQRIAQRLAMDAPLTALKQLRKR